MGPDRADRLLAGTAYQKREGWWDWAKPAAHRGALRWCKPTWPGSDAENWVPWAHELDATAATRYAREQVLSGADGWDPEGGPGDAAETDSLSDNGRTVHIDTYYEDELAFRERLKREGRSAAFKGTTPEDFEAWQIATRVRLFDLLGLSIMDRVSIEARELDRVQIAGGIVRTHADACRWSATFGCRSTCSSRSRLSSMRAAANVAMSARMAIREQAPQVLRA